jgi:tetratricopeptide (TPR) repeat protein
VSSHTGQRITTPFGPLSVFALVAPLHAADVTLTPSADAVATGATFSVSARVSPPDTRVKWRWNHLVRCTRASRLQAEFEGVRAGDAIITATPSDGINPTTVRIEISDAQRPTPGPPPTARPAHPPPPAPQSPAFFEQPTASPPPENGPWERKDAEGRVIETATFQDGRAIHRVCHYFDARGRDAVTETISSQERRETVDRTERNWHENGNLSEERSFRNDVPHGDWTFFDENGSPVRRVTYAAGVPLPQTNPQPGSPEDAARDVLRRAIAAETPSPGDIASLATALSAEERAALARLTSQSIAELGDDSDPLILDRLHRLIIDACPEAPEAHGSYRHLCQLLLGDLRGPRYTEIVSLLEQFLSRYTESTVLAMEKHPDDPLLFSPLRTLHVAYEALSLWPKIIAHYQKATASGTRLSAPDCLDYARALEASGRGPDAIPWYEKYLAAEPDIESFSAKDARRRLDALKLLRS